MILKPNASYSDIAAAFSDVTFRPMWLVVVVRDCHNLAVVDFVRPVVRWAGWVAMLPRDATLHSFE